MNSNQLTGQTEQHLCSATDAELLGARVHSEVVRPFLQLQDEARRAGFDLAILSGFRDFERQLAIWNRKARGQQPVLDSDSVPLDIEQLSEKELVFAIMRWSALPGASRHHRGTDLDVFDAAAKPQDYEIELLPDEVDSGGMFGPRKRADERGFRPRIEAETLDLTLLSLPPAANLQKCPGAGSP